MGLWISLWSLCVWFIKWDILGAALFSILGNDLVEQTNCSLMNYPDIKAGAGASRWGMEPDSKRAERQPHLKGGNSCNALYLCVRLMQRRGVWGHTGGGGVRTPLREGALPAAGRQDVLSWLGRRSWSSRLLLGHKERGKWVGGCGRRKNGEAQYRGVHEMLMDRGMQLEPAETGTARNWRGQRALCFRAITKTVLTRFYFFLSLCCLHHRGWLVFLLSPTASNFNNLTVIIEM